VRVTLLGTGTPAPSLRRQSAGYLVEVGDDMIVLDHGPGAHHRLMEAGFRATDVGHAFFSHMHYDHCLDYPRLVLQRWDMGAGDIPDLAVYGPPPIRRMTDLLFGEQGVFDADIRARTGHRSSIDVYRARGGVPPRARPAPRVREVRPGDVVNGPSWTVRVGHAVHVQPYLECLAFRIDCDEGSICYSGDSGACDDIMELARGADILIHMHHHISGTEPSPEFRAACGNHEDNARIAERAGVRTLVLTHLTEPFDQPATRERVLREIRQVFDGTVVWGEDLMRIELRPGSASITPRPAD